MNELDLLQQYRHALLLYVESPDETRLAVGYELGRDASDSGIGPLQLSETHHQMVGHMVRVWMGRELSSSECMLRVAHASEFFAECLAPIEMIYRGYHTQASTLERMDLMRDAQATLTRQATHDGLTGLPNRTLLVDRIDQALSHARRFGRCTAVFFADLDRFKHINDTKGHAAGDIVLQNISKTMIATVRPMDTVARIGGDEFAILASEVDNHLHAVDISDRLLAELNKSTLQSDESQVGASIGVSVAIDGRGTAESLLEEADTAMYKAKALGGGRSEIFDAALGREVQERAAAHHMLQSALDQHRIIVHYQPVIDLLSGDVSGFEALVRIMQDDGSVIAPNAFIPVAEDTGLVIPLGTQVLSMACQEASHWPTVGSRTNDLTIAVNISARQFERGNLTNVVQAMLDRSGLKATCLHLELTETAIIDLRPDVIAQLVRLRDLGVQIGLDDFGTGYASLTHLRRLPLTFVKIDQSFVEHLATNDEDERIVSAVVDLASHLGLRSIAEGVETQAQLDHLRELGCDQAQGYLFARPLPAGEVLAALAYASW